MKESVTTSYCFAIQRRMQLFGSWSLVFQFFMYDVPFEKELLEIETFQIQWHAILEKFCCEDSASIVGSINQPSHHKHKRELQITTWKLYEVESILLFDPIFSFLHFGTPCELESTRARTANCCLQLHSLTGSLGNLACSLCGKTEMEFVLSCVHLPCIVYCSFSLLPLICCQVFNPISIQACSFQMNNIIPLKCDSSNKKLKHTV